MFVNHGPDQNNDYLVPTYLLAQKRTIPRKKEVPKT